MKQLHFILFWVMSIGLLAQAPQGIPYQAVVRNVDGTVMSNTAITITFKIHDVTAAGVVVYEETHAVTSNSQGLVSMNVGSGTVVTGAFDNINWGGGNKFLHVLMNAGNGNIDLGTQQMMSVPYALYAEDVNVRVSVTGDSLFIGNQVSIVPGVSAANDIQVGDLYQGGYVAYLFQPGDLGYVANERHGIIVSTQDVGVAVWGCYETFVIGTDYYLGSGIINTNAILSYSCGLVNTAAQLCSDYIFQGYADWQLPSYDELMAIYTNLHNSVSFTYGSYWTSTQESGSWSKSIGFNNNGSNEHSTKNSIINVRAIRYF
ncbi:MAG: hypothetical protein RL362_1193 [Bacteroidota bacterium]